jgi:hypothetical protein
MDAHNNYMELNTDRFKDFLLEQNRTWQLSADNYRGLDKVEEREFIIDGSRIKVQFNPERMRSSNAKVDQNAISARKCFLCSENRPAEQNNLKMVDDFILLVNPYPIFHLHFTIPSIHHIPQRLISNLETIFAISRQMEGYTLFYNGPECGASAPDHLHFQAGENGFMPVESEFEDLKQITGTWLFCSEHLNIWAFDNYIRKMISFETDRLTAGINALEDIYARFREIQPGKIEPMMNLLCYFKGEKWVIHLFPRKLHRPWQFFEEGALRLLISPASVDFGGVFITPRREDFDKITADDIKDIFNQVCLDDESFEGLKRSITNYKLRINN